MSMGGGGVMGRGSGMIGHFMFILYFLLYLSPLLFPCNVCLHTSFLMAFPWYAGKGKKRDRQGKMRVEHGSTYTSFFLLPESLGGYIYSRLELQYVSICQLIPYNKIFLCSIS